MRYRLFLVAFLLLLPTLCQAEVKVYRDSYGIPSIVANSSNDVMFGLGYATAEDHAEHMNRNFRQARGRLAEIDGPSKVLQDTFIRSIGFGDVAERHAQTYGGELKAMVQSFVRGANAGLEKQKGKLPSWVEPVTEVDVLALMQMMNAAFALSEVAGQLFGGGGSNQFVVGPKRSKTGNAILSADPHLDWSGIFLWYEFAIYSKEFNFRGVTIAGLPLGIMGHNSHVAWSITNNNPAHFTTYTYKLNPEAPDQYNHHGEWRKFDDMSADLKVMDGGELKTRKVRIRRTAWGATVPLRPQSIYLSMLGDWSAPTQVLAMMRAHSATEFRKALSLLGLSMWNLVYADTKGNIGYQYCARVQDRDGSFNWRKPVDGSLPNTKLGAFRTIDQLPNVVNPASGMLVNANSDPRDVPVTSKLPDVYPSYVASYAPTSRYNMLSNLLTSTPKVDVDKARRIATDTELQFARLAIRNLSRVSGTETSDAVATLSRWDGRADIDSKGTLLFQEWILALGPRSVLVTKSSWTDVEERAVVDALKVAADRVMKRHGRLAPEWGKVHTSTRGVTTVPVSGTELRAGGLDFTSAVPNSGVRKDGVTKCDFGSSFRMIVHLNPKGIESWSILPYGNVQRPDSKHYTDQMALFGRGQYKPTNFGRGNIEKRHVSVVTLRP